MDLGIIVVLAGTNLILYGIASHLLQIAKTLQEIRWIIERE